MKRRALVGALTFLTACGDCGGDKPPAAGTLVRRIEDPSALIEGIEATGRVGDYLLDNGRVRFIVQEPGSSTGWGLYGGSLVDFDVVKEGGPSGQELLEEIFVQCDLRGFAPVSAEIISDGAGGTDGVLRLTGADAGIPFLDAILPRDPLEVTMSMDFILPPTGRTLELVVRVKDERKTRAREIACGLVLLPGDEYTLASPTRPLGAGLGGENDYLAAFSPEATTSYVLHRPDEKPVDVVIEELGIIPIGADSVPFLANATVEERYFLSVGERGDLDSALEAMRERRPAEGPLRAVALMLSSDVALGSVSVLVQDANGRPVTSVNGTSDLLTFSAPPGAYEGTVQVKGRALDRFSFEVMAGEGAQEIAHVVERVGRLRFTARASGLDGADGGPTPARLRIVPGHGAALSASPVYDDYVPAEVEFPFPAGEYTVIASRGPAHELSVANVTIATGATAEVQATLRRSVDTTGWVAADMHVHGTRSADSETSRRLRVLGAIAEGLDVLVATDHDAVTDYGPTAAELGVSSMLHTVPGIEMSMLYGHINGYPVPAATPQDHWRPAWFVYDGTKFERVRDPAEVADELKRSGAKIVQLNHPRSSTAVFDYLGVDEEGESTRAWPDADAAELLNGKRVDEYATVLVDLFRLLENGRRLTAVGTSDIHTDLGIGYARTYIRANGSDDAELWSNLAAGHAVASLGPFVVASLRADTTVAGAGETLVASGPVAIDVHIEAPEWMDVAQLRIYENGVVLHERALTAADRDATRPAIRFDGTVTATPTVDSYYLVEVSGGASPPLLDETKAAVNPIFVDTAGDGWSFR